MRQELEVNQSDDNVAPTPMRGQESVLPQSVAVSSNWEDHSSFGGGNGFSGLIDSTGLHNERCGWSPEPVLTTRQKIQSRKVVCVYNQPSRYLMAYSIADSVRAQDS